MVYDYSKQECQICGRKILVEAIRIGVNHTANVEVTCLSCLMKNGIDKDFKHLNPEIAKDIEDWYLSSEQTKNGDIK